MCEAENVYTSISCNRTPGAADWGQENNLVAYGACNSIGIFDPQLRRITRTFVGHKDRVNAVKWIAEPNSSPETKIVSGSNDGTVIFWDCATAVPRTIVLTGHKGSVTSVDALCSKQCIVVVSASGDSTIKLWKGRHDSDFECVQTIDLKTGISFAVKLVQLPGTDNLLLLYSADDDKVHVLIDDNEDGSYRPVNQMIGHEDWVRGIDVIVDESDLLVATCSQDTFIRLWRISPRETDVLTMTRFSELDDSQSMQIQENRFTINSKSHWSVTLESVLQSHAGWVYSVAWNRCAESNELQLLSSSIDQTIVVWKLDTETGVWMEEARLGKVGGNTLGFFGAKLSKSGRCIMAHGFQGSFHIWNRVGDSTWTPGVIVSGHFAEVRDLQWEPKGQFLYSVSADQTTRIHAPWSTKEGGDGITWHELARPQVHGYDMQCLTVLSRFQFASAAEEKIVRTFKAPGNFVDNLKAMVGDFDDSEATDIIQSDTRGAAVPSLGLSNKSVSKTSVEPPLETKHVKDEYPENYFDPITLTEPPTEEALMQNTLWPEQHKLYGHGYEIYSLACTMNGNVLASACKATNEEHAQIILWDTKTWKQIDRLVAHKLTITQMKFSPCDQFLLSVSRDRRFAVFAKEDMTEKYTLQAVSDQKNGVHSRIIWTCDWSHDSKYFATGSRDGKVVAWSRNDQKTDKPTYEPIDVLTVKDQSITALAFAHSSTTQGKYVAALGTESGRIYICVFLNRWELVHQINSGNGHHLTVKKVMFRPNVPDFELASCGDDHLIRIYRLNKILDM